MKTKRAGLKSESALIADQLHRAFYGDAWHGPALLELLEDVDAATASVKPLGDVHSIWELVLHIAAWDGAGIRRLAGKKTQLKGKQNFPPVPEPATGAAWREAVERAQSTHDALVKTVAGLSASRLCDIVPGKRYNFCHMLHGIAQHELYHAGQIAILKKVQPKQDMPRPEARPESPDHRSVTA
ncbi:MAG TPA: DinB family protein [Candidatus Acidoferrales bacterium]|nr:DinB family protein [Candidatus Acidoferrales bacterium]